jgi:hypothetical protein
MLDSYLYDRKKIKPYLIKSFLKKKYNLISNSNLTWNNLNKFSLYQKNFLKKKLVYNCRKLIFFLKSFKNLMILLVLKKKLLYKNMKLTKENLFLVYSNKTKIATKLKKLKFYNFNFFKPLNNNNFSKEISLKKLLYSKILQKRNFLKIFIQKKISKKFLNIIKKKK